MTYCYEYPRPTVTVDAAVVTVIAGEARILLIKRGHPPFAGHFALPGGFLEMDEPPAVGAARELQEETGVTGCDLKPVFACGEPGRDPRARCMTFLYGALVSSDNLRPQGADDAAEAAWIPLFAPPAMAFDHARMLEQIRTHIAWQARTACIGRQFLPAEFDAAALTELHEIFGVREPGDPPLARGKRLGLIVPGARDGYFRFSPLEVCGHPDYAPLVW